MKLSLSAAVIILSSLILSAMRERRGALLTKILSVNNSLLITPFSVMFPSHESLQIVDYVGRVLGTGRTAYSETGAGKEEEIRETSWGWAKGHGSSESALCHRVCFTDRMPMESFATG
jgi:hypothetical protein